MFRWSRLRGCQRCFNPKQKLSLRVSKSSPPQAEENVIGQESSSIYCHGFGVIAADAAPDEPDHSGIGVCPEPLWREFVAGIRFAERNRRRVMKFFEGRQGLHLCFLVSGSALGLGKPIPRNFIFRPQLGCML